MIVIYLSYVSCYNTKKKFISSFQLIQVQKSWEVCLYLAELENKSLGD